MSDQIDLDNVDYAILSCLNRDDIPQWKKALHDHLHQTSDMYPGEITVSLQTVIRRIDDLHRSGHISSVIINPSDLDRDLIIGYQLADTGRDALHEKREELLRTCLPGLFSVEHIPYPKTVLTHLVAEHYGLSVEMINGYSKQELIFIAGLHQIQRFAESNMSNSDIAEVVNGTGVTDLSTLL